MPLWVPREYAGMLAVDCGRGRRGGARFQTPLETIKDVLERDRAMAEEEPAAGLSTERRKGCSWPGTVAPVRTL